MREHPLIAFLTFDLLLTPKIIQWVWLLGVAAIVYLSVLMMTFTMQVPWFLSFFLKSTGNAVNSVMGLIGLVFLILGNLAWRILCEALYGVCTLKERESIREPE